MEEKITEKSFFRVAIKNYDNVQCTSLKEFEDDIKRFSYLKKLFARYVENNELKERLILNHLIILHNVFGVATPELLFFKIDDQYWGILATFMLYLNIMPDTIPEFNIKLTDLQLDYNVINTLRNI